MLNSTEYQYIRDLVLQMYNQNYHNYVCITNNPVGSNTSNVYDVDCYFSQNNISNQSNQFGFQNGVKISLDSNNYSTSNTIDKIRKETFSSRTVTASTTEYVYSNVGQYANLIADYETSLNNHLSINYAYLIPSLILLLIMINFIKSMFRKRV